MALSKGKAKFVERLRNPRLRSREGYFIVEGVRGAREVLQGELTSEVRFVLTSPGLFGSQSGRGLVDEIVASGFPMEEVSDREMGVLSDTEHSQGVLMAVKEPPDSFAALEREPAPRVLLLDGVQDPGNVGTLVRAARAFGLSGVIALEGTVDPFNPKVVRASAGALAHIPVHRLPWIEAAAWLEEKGVPLLVADAGGEDVKGFELLPSWALAVGNEGMGPREELAAKAAGVLSISMEHGVDSLNAGVAGAILLFALCTSSGKNAEN